MSQEELLKGLRKTVKQVLKAPYYQKKLAKAGIYYPDDIKTLEDFQKIPLTEKEDLRQNYPFGLFAEPMEDIIRIHASSGTTGKPSVVGYTREDINLWGRILAKGLRRLGITSRDVVQISFGYGLFTGGMGLHHGCEELGTVVIPMSGGNTQKQLMIMRDFGSTVLCCTPSYALYLGESLEEAGISKEELKLRIGIFGAEPWSEQMRKEIEDRLGLKAVDIYGLSEIMGPGVSLECLKGTGLHFDEHFYPEILDENGNNLPEGEIGELVITTLDKQGFPALRYRTKDLTSITYGSCTCGHTGWTMQRICGRVDDMLIIRGVNVFPSQIEEAILSVSGIEPHYLIVVDRVGALDTLEVLIEVKAVDEIRELEDLQQRLLKRIEDITGLTAKVRLVEPKSIPRSEGKAKRVEDRRIGKI
ncbi:MAG: phenylacetate--CoA ligase family protein [Desulfitobacteriia bacterium]